MHKAQLFSHDRPVPLHPGLGLLLLWFCIPYTLCVSDLELSIVTWTCQGILYIHCFSIPFFLPQIPLCFLIRLVIFHSSLKILPSEIFSYFFNPQEKVSNSCLLLVSFVSAPYTADSEIIYLWLYSPPVDWKLLEDRASVLFISFTWNSQTVQFILAEQNHLNKGSNKTISAVFSLQKPESEAPNI